MNGPTANVLQANEMLQGKAKEWCERLRNLLEEKKLTQKEFADLLNEKFYGEKKQGPISQKNVSNWLHVGLPDRKGHNRPFPRFEIMLQIAAALEVDLGYLIDEIECKTYDAQKASDYTGLDETALVNLRSITYFNKKFKRTNNLDTLAAITSELIKSQGFPNLINELYDLSRLHDDRMEITESVAREFGEELAAKAFEHADDFVSAGLDASKEEMDEANAINEAAFEAAGIQEDDRERFTAAVAAANKAISDCASEYALLKQAEGAQRYRAQRALDGIIDSIFPSLAG